MTDITGPELLVHLRYLRSAQQQAGALATQFAQRAHEQGVRWVDIAEAAGLTRDAVRQQVRRGAPLKMIPVSQGGVVRVEAEDEPVEAGEDED